MATFNEMIVLDTTEASVALDALEAQIDRLLAKLREATEMTQNLRI